LKQESNPEGLEGIYTKAHAAIRADPNKARDPKEKGRFGKRDKPVPANKKYEKKNYNQKKLTLEERRARRLKKIQEIQQGAEQDDEQEEEQQ